MTEKLTKWQKFKKFCKRNMTPTWAKHFSYQVVSFIISVVMIIGVADYAFTQSYDSRKLTFVDGFTISVRTGAYDTTQNSIDFVKQAIKNKADAIQIDVRQRTDGTVVMCSDLVVTNTDGIELSQVFALLKNTSIKLNLDIKDNKCLATLHDLLVEYGMIDRTFLTGIESYSAKSVKENCPGVDFYINAIPSRIKIFSEDYQEKLLNNLNETGAIGINCNVTYCSTTLAQLLHKNGYKLSLWGVEKTSKMKKSLSNKPDNITCKDVETLQKTIKEWKHKG